MTTARLILEPPQTSEQAMAGDCAALRQCAAADQVLVRLYTWQTPTISLGFMQGPSALNIEAMKRDHIGWIRRPTGGRAVLHGDDLTYSIAFPVAIAHMGASLLETYKIVAAALSAGLAHSAIPVAFHDSTIDPSLVRGETRLPCFLAPNRDELMSNGKKLFGSAQKRTKDAVLQHGSIPLGPLFRVLPRYCNIPNEQQEVQIRLLHEKCTCVSEVSTICSAEQLQEHLARGFEQTLPFDFCRTNWTAQEQAHIDTLATSQAFRQRYLSA